MGTRISQFTPLTTVASADYFPLVQDSDTTNKRVSLASLLASVPLGSAATPSIAFTGDLNTGIYSPGADQVAVATNGTGRLFVDASGNVGVGTSSVNALLEVNNSTAGGEVQRIEGNYSGSGSVILTNWRRAGGSVAAALKYNDDSSPLCMSIGTTTSHEFRIRTADTDAITIDASQRVGIGTSSPTEKLTIDGNVAFNTNAQYIKFNSFYGSPYTGSMGSILAFNSAYGAEVAAINFYQTGGNVADILFRTGSAGSSVERVRINSSGNVGIGSTAPTNKLVVASSGVGYEIDQTNIANTNILLSYDRGASVYRSVANYYGGTFSWNDSGLERARIDSSGRLLVGTSTASSTDNDANFPYLQLEGVIGDPSRAMLRCNGGTDQFGGPHLYLSRSRGTSSGSKTSVANDDMLGDILFLGADGADDRRAASIRAFVDGTPGANDMPGRLVFSTTSDSASSPTERLRITSTGQVRLAGAGITFNGDTAAANELDDYEEGTWTSAITCGTSGTITVAATHNTQSYTKIGRQVTVTANLYISAVSSPVGTVTITGLPFTSGSGNGLRSAAAILATNLTSLATTSVVGRIMDNSSSLVIGTYNAGGENDAASYFQAASTLYVSLTYFV
jgi:hypothetical protein